MKTKKVKVRSKEWFEKNGYTNKDAKVTRYMEPGGMSKDLIGKIINANKTSLGWYSEGWYIDKWMCEPDTWKNEKIRYEIGLKCQTPCPYNKLGDERFVFSHNCTNTCNSFVKVNKKKQIVTCSYKKDKALEAKPLKIRGSVDISKHALDSMAYHLSQCEWVRPSLFPIFARKYNEKDMQKAYEAGANTKEQFDKWIKDFK